MGQTPTESRAAGTAVRVLSLGCEAGEEQPIADVTKAPAQTTEAPAQTNEAAPGGDADQPVDGGLTAEEAIDAVEAAGIAHR